MAYIIASIHPYRLGQKFVIDPTPRREKHLGDRAKEHEESKAHYLDISLLAEKHNWYDTCEMDWHAESKECLLDKAEISREV